MKGRTMGFQTTTSVHQPDLLYMLELAGILENALVQCSSNLNNLPILLKGKYIPTVGLK